MPANKADLWLNKKWINYQMKEGKTLVDIGAPPQHEGQRVLRP
jgi:hypothetical protein